VKDYRSWARGLKNAGYATDPLYDVKLIRIIEDNRLYLLDSGETLSAGTMLSQATLRQDRQTVSEIALEVASDLVDPDSFVAVVSSRTKNNKKNRINGKRNRP
jgi:hypothetical protein